MNTRFTQLGIMIVAMLASPVLAQNTYPWPQTGNVSIGTASASSVLTVYGTNAASWNSGIELQRQDGGNARISVTAGNGMLLKDYGTGTGAFDFRSNADTSLMTILTNGNVGVGTSSPEYVLTLKSYAGSNTTHLMGQMTDGTRNLFTGIFAKAASPDWAPILMSDTSMLFGIDRGNGVAATSFKFFSKVNETQDLTTLSPLMVIQGDSGNVGIGTTSPGTRLEVNGNVKLTAGSGSSITFADGTVQSTAYTGVSCGGDFAESVDVTGNRHHYEPGDLLVIDPDHPGDFDEAAQPYSTLVAGIYSTKPGYVGRRLIGPKSPDEVPLAMVGIVPTKVTAENGPIHTGDLLVASSTPGRAMKGTDRGRLTGAVVGKALGTLESGNGTIEVLVTLQ